MTRAADCIWEFWRSSQYRQSIDDGNSQPSSRANCAVLARKNWKRPSSRNLSCSTRRRSRVDSGHFAQRRWTHDNGTDADAVGSVRFCGRPTNSFGITARSQVRNPSKPMRTRKPKPTTKPTRKLQTKSTKPTPTLTRLMKPSPTMATRPRLVSWPIALASSLRPRQRSRHEMRSPIADLDCLRGQPQWCRSSGPASHRGRSMFRQPV
jgi:hypothetical protein